MEARGAFKLLGGEEVGFFSDLFGGKEGEMHEVSTLTPEQRALANRLASFYKGRIGKGLPTWGGRWVEPLTPEEQQARALLTEFGTTTPSIWQSVSEALAQLQETATPEGARKWYEEFMLPERQYMLEKYVLPEMREAGIGAGLRHSSATDTAIARAIQEFGLQGLTDVGNLYRERFNTLMGMLPFMEQIGFERPSQQAAALQQAGEMERLLRQYALEKEIEAYYKSLPELSPILGLAQQYIGLPMKATYYEPGRPSPFMTLASSVIPAIGQYMGANRIATALSALAGGK